jgi:hypothetical protein
MTDIDFSVFEKAGVRPRHLSKVLTVSRVTASNWLNGKSVPHTMIHDKVADVYARVAELIDSGDLPLPQNYPSNEVNPKILSLLRGRD